MDDFSFSGRESAIPTVARGYGRTLISSPSGSGRSSAAKQFLLHFELKMKQGIFQGKI